MDFKLNTKEITVKKKKKEREKKKKKLLLRDLNIKQNCKSSCCNKYKKGEKKRCSRCPMHDLLKKIS